MDSEVSGTGNQYDYGFRIYNPRIAKFLSVDPLTKSYPWYTPYQFAGNMPIWAVDIDGLEPGVVFGSANQVTAIEDWSKTFKDIDQFKNENWLGIKLVTIADAINKLETHKKTEGKIESVYLQTHGTSGGIYTIPGNDMKIDTKAAPRGVSFSTDDQAISPGHIGFYNEKMDIIDAIEKPKKKQAAYEKAMENEYFKGVSEFIKLTSIIDDNGTLILGGCYSCSGVEGQQLFEALYELTGARINIIGNNDLTADVIKDEVIKLFLNYERTGKGDFQHDWSIIGPSTDGKFVDTNQNIKLNANGESYEFVGPLEDKK